MLATVEARLKTNALSLKKIDGVVNLEAALKKPPPKDKQPAAFVLPVSDTAGQNNLVNAVSQRIAETFGVVLCLGNLSDSVGGTATEKLEAIKIEVMDALINWEPTAAHDPVTYKSGRVVAMHNGVVWWLLEFNTAHHYRKT